MTRGASRRRLVAHAEQTKRPAQQPGERAGASRGEMGQRDPSNQLGATTFLRAGRIGAGRRRRPGRRPCDALADGVDRLLLGRPGAGEQRRSRYLVLLEHARHARRGRRAVAAADHEALSRLAAVDEADGRSPTPRCEHQLGGDVGDQVIRAHDDRRGSSPTASAGAAASRRRHARAQQAHQGDDQQARSRRSVPSRERGPGTARAGERRASRSRCGADEQTGQVRQRPTAPSGRRAGRGRGRRGADQCRGKHRRPAVHGRAGGRWPRTTATASSRVSTTPTVTRGCATIARTSHRVPPRHLCPAPVHPPMDTPARWPAGHLPAASEAASRGLVTRDRPTCVGRVGHRRTSGAGATPPTSRPGRCWHHQRVADLDAPARRRSRSRRAAGVGRLHRSAARLLREVLGRVGPAVDGPLLTATAPWSSPVRGPDWARHAQDRLSRRRVRARGAGAAALGRNGAVRLLRADPHRRALLLERLHHDDLTSVGDLEACEVVAGLYAACTCRRRPGCAR